jgi:hypothetical protein
MKRMKALFIVLLGTINIGKSRYFNLGISLIGNKKNSGKPNPSLIEGKDALTLLATLKS